MKRKIVTLPEDLFDRLTALAATNRRSLMSEILWALEQYVAQAARDAAERRAGRPQSWE